MAKVEMDLSEFEVLKENKVLLEASLKNERDLREKINLLNKEKIKALEDARMKVVKIVKSEHMEHHYIKRDARKFLIDFCYRFGITDVVNKFNLDRPGAVEAVVDRIHNSLFETVTSTTSKFPQEITMEGLDDVRNELKREIEQTINNDITTKLKIADGFEDTKQELLLKISDLNNLNDLLNAQNDTLLSSRSQTVEKLKICEEEKRELNKINKQNTELISKIIETINANLGVFSIHKLIPKLTELLNKKN